MEALNNQTRSDTCRFAIGNGDICGINTATDGHGTPLPVCHAHLDAYMQQVVPVRSPILPTFQDWLSPRPDDGENSVVPTPSAPVDLARFEEFGSSPRPTTRHVSFDDIPLCIETARECCVCFDDSQLLSLPCRHTTCFSCYERLHRQTCPMCRAEIISSFVRRL